MPRAILKAFLPVCPVAQNCLVEAYLTQLLGTDPRIRSLKLEQCGQLSPTNRRNLIFIIDQCGLEIPFCACLRQLRHYSSDAKFLVLDEQKSADDLIRVVAMGAHGYVSHADVSRTLIHSISAIASNQLWIPSPLLPEFLREVNLTLRKNARARQTTSPREDEILELVRRRFSNREIADMLQIRVSTVKFHLSNIFSKFNAHNRRDLIEPTSRELWRLERG